MRARRLPSKTAVQGSDQRIVEFLFAHRDDEQIGLDPFGVAVTYLDFHPAFDQVLWRISVMNSLRVSWRVRKAPSRLLVIT